MAYSVEVEHGADVYWVACDCNDHSVTRTQVVERNWCKDGREGEDAIQRAVATNGSATDQRTRHINDSRICEEGLQAF